jgi:hypothetical protein
MTPDASGKLNLSVSVTNSGNGTATNTKVTLSGFKATGLLLDETLPTKDAGTLTVGRTVNLSYALRVTPEFVPGIQELTATVIYTDSGGTAKREDITLYLSVNKRPQDQTTDAVVQMSSMKQSTTNPGSSNTITLSLGFTNIGALAATNATLAIDGLSSSSFSLMGSFGDVKVGTIEPGQTASLDIPLYVSEGLSAGNYPTDTILTFTDASGASRTVETTIYIYITRPGGGKDGESDTSVPRVIINQHSFSVASVTAGTPFTLNFSLLNTSKNKDLKNMKVTVQNSGDAGVFLPVAGVNSFYVEALARGEATELSIELIPRQDAESKSFPVSIGIEYEEDNEGNKTHAVTETLSIPVYQPQRFEVSNQYFNPDGMGNAMLTFQFVNKGKSSLYNLTIKIEGPMSFMEGEYFFGTLQPGMMEYFEDTVIPQVTGDISGELVVMYEDSAGALLEYREPLQTFIDGSMPVGPDFPGPGVDPFDPTYPGIDEPLPEEGGGKILGMASWLFWTLLGVVVLIIVIVIIVVVRKKKAKKALMDDDE